MHADAHQPSKFECPRCGYDLAPVIRADAIGVDADVTCSECGLALRLDELARGAAHPPWFIEAHARRYSVPTRFLHTFMHSFFPERFWRDLRMDAPVSLRGVLLYVLGIFILIHATHAARAVVVILPETGVFPPARIARSVDLLVPDIALAIAFPYCPARGGDLLFAAAQGSPERAIDFGTIGRFLAGIARSTVTRLPITFSTVAANADATGLYSSDTRPPFSGPPNMAYPSASLVNSARIGAVITAGAALPIAAVLLLLLLPGHFRRAHLLRTHLLRAAIYALGIVPAALFLLLVVATIEVFTMGPTLQRSVASEIARTAIGTALTWGIPLFSLVWLHSVCKHYLRLPRPWGVSALLNGLLVLVILVAFDRGDW
jgi:hypothetical protein